MVIGQYINVGTIIYLSKNKARINPIGHWLNFREIILSFRGIVFFYNLAMHYLSSCSY
jgi:hypothetical protein